MENRAEASGRWLLLELSIGVAVFLLVACLAWLGALPIIGDTDTVSIGSVIMPARRFTALLALVLAFIGLVWMLRIFRRSNDGPPPWRYRDH